MPPSSGGVGPVTATTSLTPTAPAPRLAVVIMAYGIRDTLPAAVRSVLAQSVPAEIVVVHSGPGDPDDVLRQAGLAVHVVRSSQRLWPGGTRNLGIASTRAPYIAFLADDCLATSGWVAARLAAHDAGAQAVASALDCHAPTNPVALAAHISLFVRRMPRTPTADALSYGASYARELFERYGLFDANLRTGEDTEFHARLAAEDAPRWHPEIVTLHTAPERLWGFLSGQYRRGGLMASSMRQLGRTTPSMVARIALQRTLPTIWAGAVRIERHRRLSMFVVAPLIVIGNAAYAAGALAGGGRR